MKALGRLYFFSLPKQDRNQPVLPGEALGYSGTSNSRRGSVAAESVESGEVSDYAESVQKHLSFLFSMVEGFGGVVWKVR